MLAEVYISVFAGYRYDIGIHAAKRRKPGESDTFRATVQHIRSPAKDLMFIEISAPYRTNDHHDKTLEIK